MDCSTSVTYPLAAEYWQESGSVNIYDVTRQLLATIPSDFLSRGGVANWSYITKTLHFCVEEAGTIQNAQNETVQDDMPVEPGSYTYVRMDQPTLPCTYCRGPESKSRGKAPLPTSTASSSTHSNSSTSSGPQAKFREQLIFRDGYCLLTDVIYERCTPAHIVPLSRSELYSEILGRPVSYLFHANMGLLLRDDVHHAYDRGDWALHSQDGVYIVHFFVPRDEDDRKLHGKIIRPERFRGEPNFRPNVKLLEWHYKQCVMMHFRGFAFRMSAADAFESVKTVP